MGKNNVRTNNFKGSAILAFGALLWGGSFVAQTYAAEHLSPFFINAFRSLVGALFLFAFLAIRSLITKKPIFPRGKEERRTFFRDENVTVGVIKARYPPLVDIRSYKQRAALGE